MFNVFLLVYFNDFSLRAITGIAYSRYMVFPLGSEDVVRLFVVGNYPMWFLTGMVVCYLLYGLYVRLQSVTGRVLFVASCVVLAVVMQRLPILLPWSVDTAPALVLFMIAGHEVRHWIDFTHFTKKTAVLLGMSVAAYVLCLPYCEGVNISIREYGHSVPLYLFGGVAGCVLLLGAAVLLLHSGFVGRMLKAIGVHSLTIFCLEMPFIVVIGNVAGQWQSHSGILTNPYAVAVAQTVMAIVGGWMLSLLLHHNERIKKLVF